MITGKPTPGLGYDIRSLEVLGKLGTRDLHGHLTQLVQSGPILWHSGILKQYTILLEISST